jgi:hypothetical protein
VKKFEEKETVWLRGTNTRVNMEVTIISTMKNPMGGWQYMVNDNKGNSLDNPKTGDQWFDEEELRNHKD